MFPADFIENSNVTNETSETGIDFVFDYETGQHIVKNGNLEECTTLEGIKQYIQNVLRTQANAYDVYVQGETDVFGVSVYEYIGTKKLPMGYINSELKREVTANLVKHPLISSVSSWSGKRERRGLNISFNVTLKGEKRKGLNIIFDVTADGNIIEGLKTVGGDSVV